MTIHETLSNHVGRATNIIAQPSEIKKAVKEAIPVPAIRALGIARGIYWRTFHPLTFGAAVALTDRDCQQVALVRPTYGDQDLWQLPGGGLDKQNWNTALEATKNGVMRLDPTIFEPSARREVKEEIGLDAEELPMTHLFSHYSDRDSKDRYTNRDTLAIFHLPTDTRRLDLRPQRTEIAEIRLWDIDELPNYGAGYLGKLALTLQGLHQAS